MKDLNLDLFASLALIIFFYVTALNPLTVWTITVSKIDYVIRPTTLSVIT